MPSGIQYSHRRELLSNTTFQLALLILFLLSSP